MVSRVKSYTEKILYCVSKKFVSDNHNADPDSDNFKVLFMVFHCMLGLESWLISVVAGLLMGDQGDSLWLSKGVASLLKA